MKFFRKTAIVFLAALMLVSLASFVGCKEDPKETEVTYTFTVQLPDGSPAVGAQIIICHGDICETPVAVDANGKLSVKKPAAEYTVHVINVPAGYECNDEYTTDLKGTPIIFKCVSSVKTPTSGDGSMYNRFEVTRGTYAVQFKSSETEELFYSFFP